MRFTGIFERFGLKDGWQGVSETTVLLRDIRNDWGKIVCDHLWFNYTKGFQRLGELKQGDIIEFQARIMPYVKGYINYREETDNRELDYKLSYPTRLKKHQKQEAEKTPDIIEYERGERNECETV